MSSKRRLSTEEEIAPNLIPMVDIMFLLLLFFMLGSDMGQRDLEDVTLPLARNVKEDEEATGKKEQDRLTINVYHRSTKEVPCPTYEAGSKKPCRETRHWRIGIRANDYSDPDNLKKLLKEEADRYRDRSLPNAASERRVMVRADRAAPYGFIEDVMTTCASVGIYKIECGAARPPDQSTEGS